MPTGAHYRSDLYCSVVGLDILLKVVRLFRNLRESLLKNSTGGTVQTVRAYWLSLEFPQS